MKGATSHLQEGRMNCREDATPMSLHQTVSQNSRTGAVAGVLLLIGIFVYMQMPRHGGVAERAQAFFTVDDGKTWFADSLAKIPPFEKDGKQAVGAHVYRCSDGTEFVNYLERYKPQAKQTLENLTNPDPNRKGPADLNAIRSAYTDGREVKRPGDANWVEADNFREVAAVTAVKCANGGTQADAVEP
jgi:hypothetical protein